jgi:hypothetical protein
MFSSVSALISHNDPQALKLSAFVVADVALSTVTILSFSVMFSDMCNGYKRGVRMNYTVAIGRRPMDQAPDVSFQLLTLPLTNSM